MVEKFKERKKFWGFFTILSNNFLVWKKNDFFNGFSAKSLQSYAFGLYCII